MVTLSVSICAMTSSAATASPGLFVSAATAPSVMESPIAGTSMGCGGPSSAAAAFSAAAFFPAAFLDLAGAAAAASTAHTGWPTLTVSPSLTSTSETTPATGARTSMVTLSVSIWAMTSSTATASPGCLSTAAMAPSVMESPMGGTSTVVGAAEGAPTRKVRCASGANATGCHARAIAARSVARLWMGAEATDGRMSRCCSSGLLGAGLFFKVATRRGRAGGRGNAPGGVGPRGAGAHGRGGHVERAVRADLRVGGGRSGSDLGSGR